MSDRSKRGLYAVGIATVLTLGCVAATAMQRMYSRMQTPYQPSQITSAVLPESTPPKEFIVFEQPSPNDYVIEPWDELDENKDTAPITSDSKVVVQPKKPILSIEEHKQNIDKLLTSYHFKNQEYQAFMGLHILGRVHYNNLKGLSTDYKVFGNILKKADANQDFIIDSKEQKILDSLLQDEEVEDLLKNGTRVGIGERYGPDWDKTYEKLPFTDDKPLPKITKEDKGSADEYDLKSDRK